MAKTAMVLRNVKRGKLAKQFGEKREALRTIGKDPAVEYDEKWDAMMALQKLPRDSSKSRYRNRCALTGRPHGYFRKFGLSRNRIREIAVRGEAPGVWKASW
ncbi:MAG: 30S ribosomal protein S14 [Arenicellales bacterium]